MTSHAPAAAATGREGMTSTTTSVLSGWRPWQSVLLICSPPAGILSNLVISASPCTDLSCSAHVTTLRGSVRIAYGVREVELLLYMWNTVVIVTKLVHSDYYVHRMPAYLFTGSVKFGYDTVLCNNKVYDILRPPRRLCIGIRLFVCLTQSRGWIVMKFLEGQALGQ